MSSRVVGAGDCHAHAQRPGAQVHAQPGDTDQSRQPRGAQRVAAGTAPVQPDGAQRQAGPEQQVRAEGAPADELHHAGQLYGEVDEVGLRRRGVQRDLLLVQREGLEQGVDQAQATAQRRKTEADGEDHQHLGGDQPALYRVVDRRAGRRGRDQPGPHGRRRYRGPRLVGVVLSRAPAHPVPALDRVARADARRDGDVRVPRGVAVAPGGVGDGQRGERGLRAAVAGVRGVLRLDLVADAADRDREAADDGEARTAVRPAARRPGPARSRTAPAGSGRSTRPRIPDSPNTTACCPRSRRTTVSRNDRKDDRCRSRRPCATTGWPPG